MIEFPVAVEGDSDDLRWALETAGVMWAQGDSKEALRWLKKAAETASENGADMRSLDLARFAADLRISLGPVPSETPGPPEVHVPAAPPLPSEAQAIAAPASVPAPAVRRALPRPPPPRKQAAEDPDEITPVPAAPSGPHAVPPGAISQPMRGDTPPAGIPASVAPTPFEPALPFEAAPVVKLDEPVPSSQAPAYSAAPPPIDPGSAEITLHQAVRVSIHPLEDQPGVFLTHVLSSGVPAPRGGYEALLVALDPRVQLIKRR